MKHGLKDEALVLDFRPSEVHEKADLEASRLQLIKELRFVPAIILRVDLQFDEHASVDNQVRIIIADHDPFVVDPVPVFRFRP